MTCTHDIADQEIAVMADGYCPLCLAAKIERVTAERDLARANADQVYKRLTAEVERLRAAILFARSVAEIEDLDQWVEHFDKALGDNQQSTQEKE